MPNLKLKYIIDENGDRVAPITHIDAVRNSNGDSLTSLISPENLGNGIGTCSTSSGTALTVSLTGYELVQDGFVAVTFTNDVPADATLNVNGKGAKSIMYKGSAITADTIKANDTITFCYDGTNYVVTSLGGEIPTFTGAISSANGSKGLVPAPLIADKDKFLKGDGTWGNVSGEDSRFVVQSGTITVHSATSSSQTNYIATLPISEAEAKKIYSIQWMTSTSIYGYLYNPSNYNGQTYYGNFGYIKNMNDWQHKNFYPNVDLNYSFIIAFHNFNPGTVTYRIIKAA